MVGDTEQVTLTSGFKSAPVTFNWAVGSNGGNNVPGPSPGATDTSGNYTFSAEVGPGLNGNWTETWFVGGVPAAQTSFSVVSLPVITGPSGSTSVSFWYLGGAATCCIDTTPANTFPTTMSVSLAVNTSNPTPTVVRNTDSPSRIQIAASGTTGATLTSLAWTIFTMPWRPRHASVCSV